MFNRQIVSMSCVDALFRGDYDASTSDAGAGASPAVISDQAPPPVPRVAASTSRRDLPRPIFKSGRSPRPT